MKIGMARALLLATAAIASCGKGGGSGMGSTGDGGVTGPTNLVVTWTLAGAHASAETCMAQGAVQIFINLSATVDPSLAQSVTLDCSVGTTVFDKLQVQDLGVTPYLEGTLLNSNGTTVPMGIVGVDVTPTLGTTNVTLAFFAPQGAGGGGAGGASASSSSQAASSSSGGASTAASSSSSSASSSASSSSSSASSSGSQDGGADGG